MRVTGFSGNISETGVCSVEFDKSNVETLEDAIDILQVIEDISTDLHDSKRLLKPVTVKVLSLAIYSANASIAAFVKRQAAALDSKKEQNK